MRKILSSLTTASFSFIHTLSLSLFLPPSLVSHLPLHIFFISIVFLSPRDLNACISIYPTCDSSSNTPLGKKNCFFFNTYILLFYIYLSENCFYLFFSEMQVSPRIEFSLRGNFLLLLPFFSCAFHTRMVEHAREFHGVTTAVWIAVYSRESTARATRCRKIRRLIVAYPG